MRASMREARSALAMRSLSWSAESARPSIMLSRNTCSEFAIDAISSFWLDLIDLDSRSPSDRSCIERCRLRIRRRMLRPT